MQQPLQMSPKDLLDYLVQEYTYDLPDEIMTPEEMNEASRLLLRLSGEYSYLVSLLSYAKIDARDAKRTRSKEEYEDAVDRKEIIANITDAVKQRYAAISRAVTIHVENNRELHMNAEGSIYG